MMAEVCIRQALIYFSFTCKGVELILKSGLTLEYSLNSQICSKSPRNLAYCLSYAQEMVSRVLSRENSCMQAQAQARQLSREKYIVRLIPVEILYLRRRS